MKTTIRVSPSTRSALKHVGLTGETYDDIIRSLLSRALDENTKSPAQLRVLEAIAVFSDPDQIPYGKTEYYITSKAKIKGGIEETRRILHQLEVKGLVEKVPTTMKANVRQYWRKHVETAEDREYRRYEEETAQKMRECGWEKAYLCEE